MATPGRNTPWRVFINAPFDSKYRPIFDAVVFTILACECVPRCALESSDSGTPRISRLCEIIADCPLSIHDLSRTQLDEDSGLPRFNMPFEFGLFVGAREFGGDKDHKKKCLVLAEKKFSYQKYISDIAGQDISIHGNKPLLAVEKVRHFLRSHQASIPGASTIKKSYAAFIKDLPALARLPQFQYDLDDLHFRDYVGLANASLVKSGWTRPGSPSRE